MTESSQLSNIPKGTIRVALVQFDYQPAAALSFPFLEEPILLDEGEQGITSLALSMPRADRVLALRKEIASAYEGFISRRLGEILPALDSLAVDLVVFPEYSIPVNCLGMIDQTSAGFTVIAASHTVTQAGTSVYQDLAIPVTADDLGKNICPIRMAQGGWTFVERLTKSRWEAALKPGTRWTPLTVEARSGISITIAVFLCVDFLNELDAHLQELIPRDLWKNVDLGVVPSYSPTIRDFEQRARSLSERTGRPILYANVSTLGGTRVSCTFAEAGPFVERHGTKPLERNEEAIIVVDLPLGGYSQFQLQPSPLPAVPSSELVTIMPLLDRDRFKTLFDLQERVRTEKQESQQRAIIDSARDSLLELAGSKEAPAILQGRLFELLGALDWRDGQWLSRRLDAIALSSESANLNEVRFSLLFRAQKLLAGIIEDPRLVGPSLDVVANVLDVYRRAIDSLRPKVSQRILQQYDPTILSIHTVKESTDALFTSLFLMRLKAARIHRDALEKQIQLISTLAHPGNRNLALNLRYVSLPNPGGNLKTLEIQIIGAARAEDRNASREMADLFRRDLANLMRITLRDAYLFELRELDQLDLARTTEPFTIKYIAELYRRVDFGNPPYIDTASAPRIHHLEGSSSLERILDTLQSGSAASMLSLHLHPIDLSEAEKSFFRTYHRSSRRGTQLGEGAMFFLGTERHPALRLNGAVTMQRMLGDTEGLQPSLLARLFVASDQPISGLLMNAIGSDLWGNDSYQSELSESGTDHFVEKANCMRQSWALEGLPKTISLDSLGRVPFIFDPYEAIRIFRLPLEGYSGAVPNLFSIIPAPAAALPEDGIELGLGFHSGAQKPIVVRLSERERTKHAYIVGKTGTGKSTLLARLIEQDIQEGSGVCVIDPHGDLVEAILARLPENRIEDVVLLDPTATDRPFGLNLLEFNPALPHHRDLVLQDTISIMRKLFYFEHSGPIFEHNLRHLVLTMLDDSMAGQGTLIEVPRPLYDSEFRRAIVPRLEDPLAADFWKQYEQLGSNYSSENLWYVVSKFDTFITDRIMRNIVGQAKSSINLSKIMEDKKILLVKLPSALIGELNAALLGMIIVSKLRLAGMARASLPPSARSVYHIYVDEFQNFAASGFDSILAEARKYGLSLTMAHQHIGQLSAFNIATGAIEGRVAEAIFGNVGTMVVFRVGVRDAKFLAEELGKPVDPEDLENLPNYYAIVKTIVDGDVYAPFTIRSVMSLTEEKRETAYLIRSWSAERYGRDRVEVERTINARREHILNGTLGDMIDVPEPLWDSAMVAGSPGPIAAPEAGLPEV